MSLSPARQSRLSIRFMFRASKKWGFFPKRASGRSHKNRDGFAIGEGSAVFVLENKKSAALRCAKIYGEVSGYAMAQDSKDTLSFGKDGAVIAKAVKDALKAAGIKKVDYINAHGTATVHNDLVETKAIKKVFGKTAYKNPVSSTKAATGHLWAHRAR